MAQRPSVLRPELSGHHLLGARLRALRERQGLSQARLGEMVYCSGHLIGKIEKAERRAQADLVVRCDEALGAKGALLGLLPTLDGRIYSKGLSNAQVPVEMQDLYGSASRDSFGDAGPDDHRPISVADIEIIEAARTRYELMYRHVGGVPVSLRIESFLKHYVLPALRASYDNDTGRRLRRAAGSLVAVAGICSYDAEEHAAARRHFGHALRLAEASQDQALGGYVSALMANQALCLDDHRQAILYTEGALKTANGRLSPALRTDLHAMQAKAYAQLGERADCLDQMRHAERAADLITSADEPAETNYVHPGLMELKNAEALLRIGDLREAQTFAETSLQLGPSDPRAGFYGYATLSMVLAARREADESLMWAQKALATANGMESWRVRDRLGLVARTLEPFADDVGVRDFLEVARRSLATPLWLAYSAS